MFGTLFLHWVLTFLPNSPIARVERSMGAVRLSLVRRDRRLSLGSKGMATIGGEPSTIGPDSPTVLTIKVLFAQPGLPIAEQGSRGRAQLLGTSFAQYERAFREQLGDMFARRLRSAPGHRRDHSQSLGTRVCESSAGIFLRRDGKARAEDVLRNKPHGRIAFRNTESGGCQRSSGIRFAKRTGR